MSIRRETAVRLLTCLSIGLMALGALGKANAQPRAGGLIREGSAPGLELLYTGDVIGYLDPCG